MAWQEASLPELPRRSTAKLVTLGFKEMTGTNVETSFFNFDALYTPQDHPAREIFGIYFVKNPEFGDINAYGLQLKS